MLPLGGLDVFDDPAFWLGLVYVTFPLGYAIYGWNDRFDVDTDRLNPRKDTFLFGARGDEAQLAGLSRRIVAVQAPFLAIFAYWLGLKFLLWAGAGLAVCALYNFPFARWKDRPVVDVSIQAGYVLVFVLSSWLNGAPQLPAAAFVLGGLFAMHAHLFGEIMDYDPDRKVGRATTAVSLGRVPSKYLVAAFLFAEAGIVLFRFDDNIIGCGLVLAGLFFVADAALIWRDQPYTTQEMTFFMGAWNVVTAASIPWVWAMATLIEGGGGPSI